MFSVPGLLQYTRMPGELMSPTVATIPTISHYERHHRPSSNPKSTKPNFQFPSLQSSPRTYYYNYWFSVISLDIILQLLNFNHLFGHNSTTIDLQSSLRTYYYNYWTSVISLDIILQLLNFSHLLEHTTTTTERQSSPGTYYYNYSTDYQSFSPTTVQLFVTTIDLWSSTFTRTYLYIDRRPLTTTMPYFNNYSCNCRRMSS